MVCVCVTQCAYSLTYMQIHCPEDYHAWYTLFGMKWAKLYCGPMLSYALIMQAHDTHAVYVDALHPTKVFDSRCEHNILLQFVLGCMLQLSLMYLQLLMM